jgi:hypothetical protein
VSTIVTSRRAPPAGGRAVPPWRRRLNALACVVLGAAMLMSTAIAAGRPSVFFDTDGYYLMGENVTQVIKRLPAVFMGDPKAMTTEVSDDDEIDITIMGARSPVYGFFFYATQRLTTLWGVAAVQALVCAWIVYLMWKTAAPTAPPWSYMTLMAGLTAGSSLPFFASFIMPDVFAGVAAAGFVLLTVFPDRLARAETIGIFLVLAFAYAVHTSHMLTAIVAIVPAVLVLLYAKAPRRGVVTGVALCLGAMAVSIAAAKLYEKTFEMRTGNPLHRPPFLMARTLADGPGRVYLRKVCKGPDNPYVLCRALRAPLTKSDDILWEETPKLGAFNALKSPDLQLLMEAQEGAFVKGAILDDPWGQLWASLGNWFDQFTRISAHDPLRDPRQFLANEYWKTTKLVDLIPNPRQCKPLGPGCKPPFDIRLTKHWHEAVIWLSVVFCLWRLSRQDVVADLGNRSAPWKRASVPLVAATVILAGMVIINAGVCGVISGAFSRYQARIVWLVPLAAGLIACRLGLALPPSVQTVMRERVFRIRRGVRSPARSA